VQAWLDEQNRRWDAELALLSQQQTQLNTMASLYLALGGSDATGRETMPTPPALHPGG
jgi:hypothetical protein